MAEKKTTEDKPTPDKPEQQQEQQAPTGATSAGTGAAGGEYVVIGDQVTLKEGDGKSYTTHRFGAKVSLTKDQAARLVGGTRPVLVKSSQVRGDDLAATARVAVVEAGRARAKKRRGGAAQA